MSGTRDGLPSSDFDARMAKVFCELEDLIGGRLVEDDEATIDDPNFAGSTFVSDLSGTMTALHIAWKADQLDRATKAKKWAEVIPFRSKADQAKVFAKQLGRLCRRVVEAGDAFCKRPAPDETYKLVGLAESVGMLLASAPDGFGQGDDPHGRLLRVAKEFEIANAGVDADVKWAPNAPERYEAAFEAMRKVAFES